MDTMKPMGYTHTMKAKDAGPMKGYQDIKMRDVPEDLVRRLKAALAAEGLSLRGWVIGQAEKTAEAYERKMGK
jgi:hypothetical protein